MCKQEPEEKARNWEKAGAFEEQTAVQRLGKELGGGRGCEEGGAMEGGTGGGARGAGPDTYLSLGAMETQEF